MLTLANGKQKEVIIIEQESIVEQKCLQILEHAIGHDVTDIHLQPREKDYKLMFRKFGQFIPSGNIPDELAIRMISYFKFSSSLDISEKRKPQSGAFQKTLQQQLYSFRISTLPSTFHKESLAIRFFRQNYTRPITTLCHDNTSAQLLLSLVKQHSGLLLVSGATGSGKTTTLYSLLHYCATKLSRHVITLEDPVECMQEELLQIQINERAGITYSSGLKSILRHSPEVIMIGEIRDKETAQIAMEAALTGHLVISTIHAKDTVNCLYRLLDLSVSMEDMRQMLLAIVTQSLYKNSDDNYKALLEILTGEQLQTAIQYMTEKRYFTLPTEVTIIGQKEKMEACSYEFSF